MTTETDDLVGRMLAGRYRVVRRLGAGGMGAVYLAEQAPVGRPVAVKVLLANLARDAVAVRRFEQEAFAASRLSHPNIVTLHELGRTDDGLLFIVMEYLEGRSLRQVLSNQGALPWERALRIAVDVTRALVEAHAQGLIHRDLKPDNVMLLPSTDGELAKVLDFGLAKVIGSDPSQKLTETQIVMGSPGFMSPEQIHGLPLDGRSDLYAVGMLLWEMLTGAPPFSDPSPIKVLIRHAQEVIPRVSKARPGLGLPPGLDELIARLASKEPEGRPRDAATLLTELKSLVADPWRIQAMGGAPAPEPRTRTQSFLPLPPQTLASWEQAFSELGEQAGEARPAPIVSGAPTAELVLTDVAEELSPLAPPASSADASSADASPIPLTPVAPSPGSSTWDLLLGPGGAPSSRGGPPGSSDEVSAPTPVSIQVSELGLPRPASTPPRAFPEVGVRSGPPAEEPGAVATVPTRRPPKEPAGRSVVGSRARSRAGRRLAALGVATVALGVGFALRPELPKGLLERSRALVSRASSALEPDKAAHPLGPARARWRAELGESLGSAEAFLAQAREQLALATARGRREADEALRRALVLDEEHTRALALLVENRAAWPDAEAALAELATDAALERALEQEPARAALWRAKGAALLARGQKERARSALEKARALDDTEPATHLWLARLALGEDAAKAEAHARRALELSAGSSAAETVLARSLRARFLLTEARELLERRLAAAPKDAEARYALAELDASEGRVDRAFDGFERAFRDDPSFVAPALAFAELALSEGRRVKSAGAHLARAAPRHAGIAEREALAVRVALFLGDVRGALERAEAARGRGLSGLALALATASARRAAGDGAGARAALDEAREQARAGAELALVLRRTGDLALSRGAASEASTAFEQAILVDGDALAPRVGLLVARVSAGEEDAAFAALKGVLEVDPRSDRDRGRAPERRFSEAPLYTRALEAAPRRVVKKGLVDVAGGLVAWLSRDDVAAQQAFERALRRDPSSPVALLYLATLDVDAKKEARALVRQRRLAALRVADATAALVRARALLSAGKLEDARRATDTLPAGRFAAAREALLGDVAQASRRPDEARARYRAALEADEAYVPAYERLVALPSQAR